MKRVYMMYGGLYGTTKRVRSTVFESFGMVTLANSLGRLPGVTVLSYSWSNWQRLFSDQNTQVRKGDQMILIGYSGGAALATVVANRMGRAKETVDLMVLYDPSPQSWMEKIHANVKRAVCYQNKFPTWLIYSLGGAELQAAPDGPKIDTIMIDENHLAVQFDSTLHKFTTECVRSL